MCSAQAVGTGRLHFVFHAKLQQGKTGIDGLIFGTPSQQPATNSRFPLATGSIPHIAYENSFTGKIQMTYYKSRAQKCSITSRSLAFASLGHTPPTSCHPRNHSLRQQTTACLFRSPAFLHNGLLNYPCTLSRGCERCSHRVLGVSSWLGGSMDVGGNQTR